MYDRVELDSGVNSAGGVQLDRGFELDGGSRRCGKTGADIVRISKKGGNPEYVRPIPGSPPREREDKGKE